MTPMLGRLLVLMPILLGSSIAWSSTQPREFVGIARCKLCHIKEYTVWAATPHANAFEALTSAEQDKPGCISCHVTGGDKPSKEGAKLTEVQCEACHGPGSLYAVASVMNMSAFKSDRAAARARASEAGLLTPTESTCRGCHNEKSPNFKGFDYASMLEKIKHW